MLLHVQMFSIALPWMRSAPCRPAGCARLRPGAGPWPWRLGPPALYAYRGTTMGTTPDHSAQTGHGCCAGAASCCAGAASSFLRLPCTAPPPVLGQTPSPRSSRERERENIRPHPKPFAKTEITHGLRLRSGSRHGTRHCAVTSSRRAFGFDQNKKHQSYPGWHVRVQIRRRPPIIPALMFAVRDPIVLLCRSGTSSWEEALVSRTPHVLRCPARGLSTSSRRLPGILHGCLVPWVLLRDRPL